MPTMMPMKSHIRWPVMKLPGITPEPCRIQTAPTRMAITPTIKLPIRISIHYAVELHYSPCEVKLHGDLHAPMRRPAARGALAHKNDALVCSRERHTAPALCARKGGSPCGLAAC